MSERDEGAHVNPAAYAFFSPAELRQLRQFVADVETLASCTFFSVPAGKVTLSWTEDGPLQTSLGYAGEEAVRAVVPIFRQLYNHTEPTSFNSIYKLLSSHAHAGPPELRDEAVAALKEFKQAEKEILRHVPIAMQHRHRNADGTETLINLTPPVLIDLFLHGHYLHKGNEKSERLEAWPLPQLAQHAFFGTMLNLRNLYWAMKDVVERILKARPPSDTAGGA